MGGMRAAVAAAIISAENDGSGKAGTLKKLVDAHFQIDGTPYATFVDSYFA